MMPLPIWKILASLLFLPSLAASAAEPTMSPQELEAWFNGNGVAEVNEGELKFLAQPPQKPVHHHRNRIRITPASLASGWTELEQCHENLDAVPEAQITFLEGRIRNLRILSSRAIRKAWVAGPTVQLQGVSRGARLCVKAQTKGLNDSGSGFYTLNNGPYMRKFLDGYYPMQVSIEIEYPAQTLQIVDISPIEQPGFVIAQQPGRIKMETFFEGELRTQVQFQRLH